MKREYIVRSTYKVTGVATVAASSKREAEQMAFDGEVEFDFSAPWGETKMRAELVGPWPDV